jgi:hypothetical protein
VNDLFAVDRASERFVFHLLFHRRKFDIVDVFAWPDERDGDDEAAQFIDCAQSFLERRFRIHPGVIRVG